MCRLTVLVKAQRPIGLSGSKGSSWWHAFFRWPSWDRYSLVNFQMVLNWEQQPMYSRRRPPFRGIRDPGNPEELVKSNLMTYSKDKFHKSCPWDRLVFLWYELGIDWQSPAEQRDRPKSGEHCSTMDVYQFTLSVRNADGRLRVTFIPFLLSIQKATAETLHPILQRNTKAAGSWSTYCVRRWKELSFLSLETQGLEVTWWPSSHQNDTARLFTESTAGGYTS